MDLDIAARRLRFLARLTLAVAAVIVCSLHRARADVEPDMAPGVNYPGGDMKRIAANRYDASSSYKRVRTRASQQEADHDLDQFSLVFQDQPDGSPTASRE